MSSEFEKAVAEVKSLTVRPSDGQLLELYGLFKQSTVGVCNTSRPGILSPKERAKWDAWSSKKGLSQDEAKRQYVKLVNSLLKK